MIDPIKLAATVQALIEDVDLHARPEDVTTWTNRILALDTTWTSTTDPRIARIEAYLRETLDPIEDSRNLEDLIARDALTPIRAILG